LGPNIPIEDMTLNMLRDDVAKCPVISRQIVPGHAIIKVVLEVHANVERHHQLTQWE